MDKKLQQLHITRIERFRDRIAKQVLSETESLQVKVALMDEEIPFDQRDSLSYEPLAEGDRWGSNYQMAWLHLTGTVPETWAGSEVVARLDIHGEGLVFAKDGTILQGISSGSVFDKDYSRDLLPLFDKAQGDETVELWIDASANDLFGLITEPDPSQDSAKRYGEWNAELKFARLALFDRDLWNLWLDLRILLGLIRQLPEDGVRRARLIRCGSEAVDVYAEDSANAGIARERLAIELSKPAAASDLNTVAIGHAHIDTAWLWPVREGVRKAERTFASQCSLLDRFPDYVFGASQPHQYEYVRDRKPELYQRIKKWVEAGRWEPLGGMYTEADCNLISGESMVRQVLYGKRFFLDEFGIDVKHLWLPDVFGYSAALPQILRKAGIDYFVTIKISWNQFNKFPHQTFVWRGIDGSEVLAHFPPESNYNSMLDADYLIPGRDSFKEKDRVDVFLSSYGVGDGGGGPKDENIEYGRRMADLEGAPKVRFGKVSDFFDELEGYRDKLDRWVGELYLELHRGTLTTQAATKRGNRKLEYRLQAVEMLHALLPLDKYPAEELRAAWKTLLINQFHDILPGSSVTETYRVTLEEYAQIEQTCADLEIAAVSKLGEADDNALTLFNQLSDSFNGAIPIPDELEGHGLADESGNPLPTQLFNGQTWARVKLAPLSLSSIRMTNEMLSEAQSGNELVLENDLIRYDFNQSGQLIGGTESGSGWNATPDGEVGNRLMLFADRPNDWDAWDVDLFYETNLLGEAKCVGIESLGDGSVGSGLRLRFEWNKSTIEQDVLLFNGSRELRFITRVDWQEDHCMLRVNFPVNVQTDRAAFDIQYGHVFRPTHRNTSWDVARFESAGHRYADLSDNDHGAALLNDCKYGYGVHDNVISLNLLRSPTYPDPDADRGTHEFTYSFYPHAHDLIRSDVIEAAARLNQPPLIMNGVSVADTTMPFSLVGEGLSLTTAKRTEDNTGWIVRIVETRGRHVTGTLTCSAPEGRIVETDLIERSIGNQSTGRIIFEMSPFEIRTFEIQLGVK
jgi:alpha-mannosidase